MNHRFISTQQVRRITQGFFLLLFLFLFVQTESKGADELGYPVVIRLIDPPLHEFLPGWGELTSDIADLRIKLNAGQGDTVRSPGMS